MVKASKVYIIVISSNNGKFVNTIDGEFLVKGNSLFLYNRAISANLIVIFEEKNSLRRIMKSNFSYICRVNDQESCQSGRMGRTRNAVNG